MACRSSCSILAVAGAIVEWFTPAASVSIALDAWTFGGLFGRVAFALPVIMLLFAAWLFRHPSTVHDNTRIGVGGILLLSSVSAICAVASGEPDPVRAQRGARQGGRCRRLDRVVAAHPTRRARRSSRLRHLVLFSLFIITKTPPNRVGERLRQLYAYLFGATLTEREPKEKSTAGDRAARVRHHQRSRTG